VRARRIGLLGDRPDDRGLLGVPGGDQQVLAWLQIGADVHGKLRKQRQIVVGHGAKLAEELQEALRVPRRGRLVFVHEVAIDTCAAIEQRSEPGGPGAQRLVVVGRLA